MTGETRHGVHATVQTGFRIPADVLASAKAAATRGKVTLTAFVISAITEKVAREDASITTTLPAVDGITTRRAVTRKPAPAPAAAVPARTAHSPTCKCGICKPPKNGGR